MSAAGIGMGMSQTGGQLVPFGKYKGQPVEVLRADQPYVVWLLGQQWFRDRFPPIYQVIINYGGAPDESPEHNAMQAAFLSDEYREQLAVLLLGDEIGLSALESEHSEQIGAMGSWRPYISLLKRGLTVGEAVFESSGWDVRFKVEPARVVPRLGSLPPCSCGPCDHQQCGERSGCHGDEGTFFMHGCRHIGCVKSAPTTDNFQVPPYSSQQLYGMSRHCGQGCVWAKEGTWSTFHRAHWQCGWSNPDTVVNVELKPQLGDDFPAVLRQVQRYPRAKNHHDVSAVVVRRHQFEGVTWDEVRQMFLGSGIRLVAEAEIAPSAGELEAGATRDEGGG